MRDAYGNRRNWALIALALFGFTAPSSVIWYTSQFYALAYMQTVLMVPYVTVYMVMIAALTLVDKGVLSSSSTGAMHGEVGQTQFLPKNVLLYGASLNGGGIDPDDYFYRTFYTGGSTNVFKFSDKELDKQLDAGRAATESALGKVVKSGPPMARQTARLVGGLRSVRVDGPTVAHDLQLRRERELLALRVLQPPHLCAQRRSRAAAERARDADHLN